MSSLSSYKHHVTSNSNILLDKGIILADVLVHLGCYQKFENKINKSIKNPDLSSNIDIANCKEISYREVSQTVRRSFYLKICDSDHVV
jgi:hypothetical protein